MTVPDEAVEAAAKAVFYDGRTRTREEMFRIALAAAAPFIAAQALDDAADKFHARLPDGTGNGRAYNSHQVALILRERAETYRSGT